MLDYWSDVRTVLRLDHIRDQEHVLDWWCWLVWVQAKLVLEVQALPLPPTATTGKFWHFWDSDITKNTFISNSSEILSNCYHHSVSFLHKKRTFNRINYICFITQNIISTFVNLILKKILVKLLVGALLSTQPHSSWVPEYST